MESSIETPTSNSIDISLQTAPAKEKTPVLTKDVPVKRSKKEERQHKKEDRSAEHFLKTLESLPDAEKFGALAKKFSEVVEENRRLQQYVTQSNKRLAGVARDKEQLQLEYNRTVLVKCKLENLCRELQKQNKTIKEESLLKIREEEERRKETQGKFQTALSEITSLLQQNNDKNNKLRDDNISMSTKFKSVVEKYELREQQVEKMARQMSLEQQLSDAKLAKCGLEARAERERLLAEIAQLKLELSQYQARVVESHNLESSLRSQLNVYTDKYDEFQNALTKSNQVFGGFKGEIDKMSKKIVKLEKECMSWKSRWQSSQTALLEMATDKRLWDERAAATERQLGQLQRLCRSMQAERTLLINTLKDHNIERPPVPVLPPAPPMPAPLPSKPDKVDAMAANCAQLKQGLAQLQNQLNVLTSKKEEEKAQAVDANRTGKAKKNKGKKNKVDKDNVRDVEIRQDVEIKQDVEEVHVQSGQMENETVQDRVKENIMVNDKLSNNISIQDSVKNNDRVQDNVQENTTVQNEVKNNGTVHDNAQENATVQVEVKNNDAVQENAQKNAIVQVEVKNIDAVQDNVQENVIVQNEVENNDTVQGNVQENAIVHVNVQENDKVEENVKESVQDVGDEDTAEDTAKKNFLVEEMAKVIISQTSLSDLSVSKVDNFEANVQVNTENVIPNGTNTETKDILNELTRLDISHSHVCICDLTNELPKSDSEVSQGTIS